MTPFCDTITIYNRIPQLGREPERYQRTVVHGVFWDGSYGAVNSKSGAETQDSVMIMLPFREKNMLPARWADAGYPTDIFTLQPGDIIIRGEITDEGLTAAQLLEKYGSECCITIGSVHNCCYGSRRLWHWEVTGK